jgi:hypothetical protein
LALSIFFTFLHSPLQKSRRSRDSCLVVSLNHHGEGGRCGISRGTNLLNVLMYRKCSFPPFCRFAIHTPSIRFFLCYLVLNVKVQCCLHRLPITC